MGWLQVAKCDGGNKRNIVGRELRLLRVHFTGIVFIFGGEAGGANELLVF